MGTFVLVSYDVVKCCMVASYYFELWGGCLMGFFHVCHQGVSVFAFTEFELDSSFSYIIAIQ